MCGVQRRREMNQNLQVHKAGNPAWMRLNVADSLAGFPNMPPLIGRLSALRPNRSSIGTAEKDFEYKCKINEPSPVNRMKFIPVQLSAPVRRRLARISRKSGLSPATIIRHAVKRQLTLWEGDGDEWSGSPNGGRKSQAAPKGNRRKMLLRKPHTSKL